MRNRDQQCAGFVLLEWIIASLLMATLLAGTVPLCMEVNRIVAMHVALKKLQTRERFTSVAVLHVLMHYRQLQPGKRGKPPLEVLPRKDAPAFISADLVSGSVLLLFPFHPDAMGDLPCDQAIMYVAHTDAPGQKNPDNKLYLKCPGSRAVVLQRGVDQLQMVVVQQSGKSAVHVIRNIDHPFFLHPGDAVVFHFLMSVALPVHPRHHAYYYNHIQHTANDKREQQDWPLWWVL